ncbi:helix-turn-helix domain-containing protein [Candidatus Bathyarchaeota archaeon]|nr:helix-turn-helix domain-containing protein [Candidatus Bathyarchaeota archaeon]
MARRRRLGARVLKAVASALRLNILRLLYERGPMSYTEIMNVLKLSPNRDAGRFAYHLKTLTGMDLIEPDPETKKYLLTDMGKTLVEFADELDSNAFRRRLLVRTSRLAIENFDRNKIAESLVREAEVPVELAQKISREAEKRLMKLGTKYLTAPLIREFVNAILIERGLEEYRHKLTRLGFPVYDVSLLMRETSARGDDVEKVRITAGSRVIEEYTLLNVLPRDIADAHISGSLYLNNLGSWILKIYGVMHDLRVFLRNGLTFKNFLDQRISLRPPRNLRSALSLISSMLYLASAEVTNEQALDYFNVFLAPFAKGLSKDEIKDSLRLFLETTNITVPTGVSLGLETVLPSFLSEADVISSGGETSGVYADFIEESQLVASLIMECLRERGNAKPIFNPSVIVKMRPETFKDSGAERILFEAHNLSLSGLPFYANLVSEETNMVSYAADGLRFSADWTKDWELDTVRTGCLDNITLNLPRAAYEARREKDQFFRILSDYTEKGLRALDIKSRVILRRSQEGLLSFLLPKEAQDPYLRFQESTCILGFVGLNEAVHAVTNKSIHEGEEALDFAEEILTHIIEEKKAYLKNMKLRFALGLTPSFDAAKRLAELDIERYGLGDVYVSGGRENPYYTSMTAIPLEANLPLDDLLSLESRFEALTPGSHLFKIPLGESEADAETLFATTQRIAKNHKIGFYTFDRTLTYCNKCEKTFFRELTKCPICGSVNAVTRFSRKPIRYHTQLP